MVAYDHEAVMTSHRREWGVVIEALESYRGIRAVHPLETISDASVRWLDMVGKVDGFVDTEAGPLGLSKRCQFGQQDWGTITLRDTEVRYVLGYGAQGLLAPYRIRPQLHYHGYLNGEVAYLVNLRPLEELVVSGQDLPGYWRVNGQDERATRFRVMPAKQLAQIPNCMLGRWDGLTWKEVQA